MPEIEELEEVLVDQQEEQEKEEEDDDDKKKKKKRKRKRKKKSKSKKKKKKSKKKKKKSKKKKTKSKKKTPPKTPPTSTATPTTTTTPSTTTSTVTRTPPPKKIDDWNRRIEVSKRWTQDGPAPPYDFGPRSAAAQLYFGGGGGGGEGGYRGQYYDDSDTCDPGCNDFSDDFYDYPGPAGPPGPMMMCAPMCRPMVPGMGRMVPGPATIVVQTQEAPPSMVPPPMMMPPMAAPSLFGGFPSMPALQAASMPGLGSHTERSYIRIEDSDDRNRSRRSSCCKCACPGTPPAPIIVSSPPPQYSQSAPAISAGQNSSEELRALQLRMTEIMLNRNNKSESRSFFVERTLLLIMVVVFLVVVIAVCLSVFTHKSESPQTLIMAQPSSEASNYNPQTTRHPTSSYIH